MVEFFYLNWSSAHYLAIEVANAAFGNIAYLIVAQLFI